ncbi:hypothetical protein RNF90_000150 [Shigella flexneri]|nr:hypothetical protein [Shigella sonnei]ELF4300035.1 hypothetical protein [Shigella flexneri]
MIDSIELNEEQPLAVVQRLLAQQGITWSEEHPPSEACRYNHVYADTVFGLLIIEWKGWKDHTGYTCELPFPINDEFPFVTEFSLDDAKAKVKAWYDYVILTGLGLPADKPE